MEKRYQIIGLIISFSSLVVAIAAYQRPDFRFSISQFFGNQTPYQMNNLFVDETGGGVNYSRTLGNNEIIVGNAQTLTINGTRYGPGCVVYRLLGPGSYDISVRYGSIKHYVGVETPSQEQSLYQEEIENIQTYSSQDSTDGICGIDYEIIPVQRP